MTSQGWSLGASSDAHSALQNKGCRPPARNCSDGTSESLGQKMAQLRRDMRMAGFIVTGFRCGPLYNKVDIGPHDSFPTSFRVERLQNPPRKEFCACDFKHNLNVFFTTRISSDFSSRPWRNLPPTWVIHIATRRPAHNTPIHMDFFLVWFAFKTPQLHVDRRVVGWCAGRHVDHPCGWQISPWPARKVTGWH